MGKQLKKQDQKTRLLNLQNRIGYEFRDEELLQLALTHKSFQSVHNERLEFLGDSILSSSITIYLFKNFPDLDEGVLSRIRSNLVKGETLAEIASELDLGACLKLGAGELKSGGHRRASILADAIEALIAAVFLDSGFDAANEFILNLYRERLTPDFISTLGKDSKTRLQEYLQARGLALPEYQLEKVSGKDHKQVFTVSCVIAGLNISESAEAKSRRNAEKQAASRALQKIEELSDG